jgi:hypothetical protein
MCRFASRDMSRPPGAKPQVTRHPRPRAVTLRDLKTRSGRQAEYRTGLTLRNRLGSRPTPWALSLTCGFIAPGRVMHACG